MIGQTFLGPFSIFNQTVTSSLPVIGNEPLLDNQRGLATDALLRQATYRTWDLMNEVWQIYEGNSYPFLVKDQLLQVLAAIVMKREQSLRYDR